MTRDKEKRDAAEILEAALPPPRKGQNRENRVLVVWNDEEYGRLQALAKDRGEKVATLVRNLTLAALDTLGW